LKNAQMHHGVQHSYAQTIFNVVKCPTGSNARERRFSQEETRTLFKSIYKTSRTNKNEMRVAVLFAIETACRIGEMLKLKWSEVNIRERYVEFLAKNTKTKSFRRVPITSTARNILVWIERHHNPQKTKSMRVFDFYNANEHHLSRQFQICCSRAKIEDIRWHDLRHEGTSRFFEKGDNLTDMEIAAITGHKSLDMLRRYAHLRPSIIVKKLW
jgi:integrase